MRASVRLCSSGLVALVVACGGQEAAVDSAAATAAAAPQPEALTHLEAFALDPEMEIDVAVAVEYANDPRLHAVEEATNLTPLTAEDVRGLGASEEALRRMRRAVQENLARKGYGPLQRANLVLAAFGADPAVVNGDHQRMVMPAGNTYGPEILLFQSDKKWPEATYTTNVGKVYWIASASSVRATLNYPPLGFIGDAFCMYFGLTTTGPVAYTMPPKPGKRCNDDASMTSQAAAGSPGAVELSARRVPPGDFDNVLTAAELPWAVRFEWAGNKQQIGVRCGAFWCELKERNSADSEPPGSHNSTDNEVKKTRKMKGWYDRQMLADTYVDASGQTQLRPSGVFARIHPLKRTQMEDFKNAPGSFLDVAALVVEGNVNPPAKYLARGWRLGENIVQMCVDGAAANQTCPLTTGVTPCPHNNGVRTWARFRHDPTTVVAACAHSSSGEWVTRFAWDPMDEGLWLRCPYGCCTPEL